MNPLTFTRPKQKRIHPKYQWILAPDSLERDQILISVTTD